MLAQLAVDIPFHPSDTSTGIDSICYDAALFFQRSIDIIIRATTD